MVKLMYEGKGLEKAEHDMGIDLPILDGPIIVEPSSIELIGTGVRFNFPRFGRLRRAIQRLLLGFEIEGIGALVKPRGRSNLLVGGGVIDAGYQGEVLIKSVNATSDKQVVYDKPIAQMIPTIIPSVKLTQVDSIEETTARGQAGGIWNMVSGKQE